MVLSDTWRPRLPTTDATQISQALFGPGSGKIWGAKGTTCLNCPAVQQQDANNSVPLREEPSPLSRSRFAQLDPERALGGTQVVPTSFLLALARFMVALAVDLYTHISIYQMHHSQLYIRGVVSTETTFLTVAERVRRAQTHVSFILKSGSGPARGPSSRSVHRDVTIARNKSDLLQWRSQGFAAKERNLPLQRSKATSFGLEFRYQVLPRCI